MIPTAAVVLAAGGSSRLGRPKQLLEWDGEPLVRHAARVALGAGCNRTIVIWGAVDVAQAVRGLDAELVENRRWQEGISTSIHAAVEAASGARILFTLADQPLVTTEHLRAILERDALIVATGYRGIAGVPAAFAPPTHAELLALHGDRGARAVIESHPHSLVVVPFEPAAVDIDRAEDLQR